MINELAYYEQSDLWGNEPLAYQRVILSDIETLIPADVKSVLDAGCGDGFLTDSLPSNLHVVGLDFSSVALAHVTREKVLASVSEMPFPDGSFDLVMANDVLEHLPGETYEAALREILRVSARYVLVTAPLLENLAAQTTRCGDCGSLYHVNHHYRSFGVADLLDLFPAQAAARVMLFTGLAVDPREGARRHLSASLGVLAEWELAVCPSCGARASVSGASAAEAKAAAMLAACLRENPYGVRIPDKNEAMVLFDKTFAIQHNDQPQQRTFRLLGRFGDQVREIPASVVSSEGELSLEANPDDAGAASRLYVELAGGPVLLRLAAPKSQRPGLYTVPAWLDVERLLNLEAPAQKPRPKDHLTLASVIALLEKTSLLEKELIRQKERADASEAKAEEVSAQGERARAELESALSRISALKMREAEALARFVDVSAALRRSERSLETSEEHVLLLHEQIDRATKSLYESAQEILRLQGRLEKAEAALETSRQQVLQLQRRLADRERSVEASNQQVVRLQGRLGFASASAEELSQRIDALTAERAAQDGEVASLRAQVQRLERELSAAQERNRALESDLLSRRLPLHRKIRRAVKAYVKPTGTWVKREEFRRRLLAQAEPSVSYEKWKTIPAGRRFVMICHDQSIDRRILQQAQALTSKGQEGIIIALSFDASDSIDECEGIPVHRVGLGRIVPDCPVYWRYQNRQRWIMWWGKQFNLLSRMNWTAYKLQLCLAYRKRRIHYPLPFDNAFRAAARLYPAELVIAHDLPALGAARAMAAEWNARLMYDSHELYSDQAAFSRPQKRILERRERECTPDCDLVLTVSDSLADRIAAKNRIGRPAVILNVTRARSATDGRPRLFHEKLALPETAKVMLFQGGMLRNRNMETLVRGFLMANEADLHLVFLGPREAAVEKRVRRIAGPHLGKRVHLMDEVPQEVLLDYTASAHFGVIPYVPCDLNTRFCMPNKMFEYIQAGLPILANDLVEIRRALSQIGGGGLVADLTTVHSTARAIKAMLARDLENDRQSLTSVRHIYCWENQREHYLSLVEGTLAGEKRHAG